MVSSSTLLPSSLFPSPQLRTTRRFVWVIPRVGWNFPLVHTDCAFVAMIAIRATPMSAMSVQHEASGSDRCVCAMPSVFQVVSASPPLCMVPCIHDRVCRTNPGMANVCGRLLWLTCMSRHDITHTRRQPIHRTARQISRPTNVDNTTGTYTVTDPCKLASGDGM